MDGEETTTTTETTATAQAEATAPVETTTTAETAEGKPYLGGESATAEAPVTEAQKQAEAPKEWGEEDYVGGIKKDEALLGNDNGLQIDSGYIKSMVPAFKEAGLSPEQANKLANAFAKVQIDAAREQVKERNAFFEQMKQESMRRYNEADWRQINAAIDSNFAPNGRMNFVIRNSELGADPEFLALLHKLGASVKPDAVAGAASGAGSGTGDANSFQGISSMW